MLCILEGQVQGSLAWSHQDSRADLALRIRAKCRPVSGNLSCQRGQDQQIQSDPLESIEFRHQLRSRGHCLYVWQCAGVWGEQYMRQSAPEELTALSPPSRLCWCPSKPNGKPAASFHPGPLGGMLVPVLHFPHAMCLTHYRIYTVDRGRTSGPAD